MYVLCLPERPLGRARMGLQVCSFAMWLIQRAHSGGGVGLEKMAALPVPAKRISVS